jgi:hypothetical protein
MTQLPPASALTPKPKARRKNSRYVAVTMTEHLYAQLLESAQAADRSVSSMIRYCILKTIADGGADGN